jgi:large subunit ribosomal protein L44e
MKIPKDIKRYCPNCKKHTEQKVKEVKGKGRSKSHPLTQFSQIRLKLKGLTTGTGNKGRYSRGALNSWKRYNKKHSKRIDLRYTCQECKKINVPSGKAIRTKKLQIL